MAAIELPDDIVTAGDYYSQTVELTGADWSDKDISAQVRKRQDTGAELFGSFVIDSNTFADNTTTIVMHLEAAITRKIGDNGEGFFDIQFEMGTNQPLTLAIGRLVPQQDVSA